MRHGASRTISKNSLSASAAGRSMVARTVRVLAGVAAAAGACTSASAQLRPADVLVVYDRDIPESKQVAEIYAGSSAIPGGTLGAPGFRPGVRVVDLRSLSAVGATGQAGLGVTTPSITYPTFEQQFRDPLRAYLNSTGLATKVRCIVLTKGLPHRIKDLSVFPDLGDNPGQVTSIFNAGTNGTFTYCSMDAEMTVLWTDLRAGYMNSNADCFADGALPNPYFGQVNPIRVYPTTNIATPKQWNPYFINFGAGAVPGFLWLPGGSGPTTLTPGDMYLVCRLDANTVTDVQNMLTRARNLVVSSNNAAFVLDRDTSNRDAVSGLGAPWDTTGNDYDAARSTLVTDSRFRSMNIFWNTLSGLNQFLVGPLGGLPAGPIVVTATSVVYVGSFGANHSGVPANTATSTTYAQSFNLAPGAVFNTLESYNGRAFGGLGQPPFSDQQQQLSGFLGAGGTFGVANVYEPLALTVPRNQPLVRAFFLSNLSWAEAAYTAVPALSWQQIVVGDPLARVVRDREDLDADSQITVEDLYRFIATPVDLNNSGTADATDRQLEINAVRAFEAGNMVNR